MDAMTRAISLVGLSQLAKLLTISHQSLRKFERNKVPAERVIQIASATQWQVTPHELRPDLYPNPSDAIPLVGADACDTMPTAYRAPTPCPSFESALSS